MPQSRLDRMLNEQFRREERERPKAEAARKALVDPFKKPRKHPGRARPHGVRAHRTSLGGEHS